MLVLPPTTTSRWSVHSRHPLGCTHLMLLMALVGAAHCMVAEATGTPATSNPSCKLSNEFGKERKFLYIDDVEHPITLMTSHRTPHWLLTHAVAIFLREFLGYDNVQIIYNDALYPKQVLQALGYNDTKDSVYDITEEFVPKALINLELWFPPADYDFASSFDLMGSSNYLGVVGRLGWFFPKRVIDQHGIVEHWRIFLQEHSDALKIFSRTDQEMLDLRSRMVNPQTNAFYCHDKRCSKGIFTPKICLRTSCAVLFASYYNMSDFVIDQIVKKNLLVRVVWLGPNLNQDFVKRNLKLAGDRSVLFFHFTPDALLLPFELTSVAFPSCVDKNDTFCNYEMHRKQKFIWNGLKSADTFLYGSLERISIEKKNYLKLIEEHIRHPELSMESVACQWMKKNRGIWELWSTGESKPSLYVVGLFPINATSSKKKFLAPGCVSAFRMAIDAINANDSILPNHNLKPTIVNTGCEPDIVMHEFIKIIKHSTKHKIYKKLVGIVGPACSDTVEPIAGVSKYFKMSIISYGAEGAIFSDREKYPYFFRTIPENINFKYVYLELFKKLKWARIASLTEDGHQYSEYLTPLQDLLQDNDILFHMRKYPQETETMTSYMMELKKQTFRIIIGDFYQDVARIVLCEAVKLNMTGYQGYVWFFPRWFSDKWYEADNLTTSGRVNCTTEEMLYGLQGHMTLSYKYFADNTSMTPENISVGQWRHNYRARLQNLNDKGVAVQESDYAGFTYDAVWTYALALNKLFAEDHSFTSNLRSPKTIERFIEYINNTDFDGVSGNINFTHGPSRLTDILVYQFTNTSYHMVARYYPNSFNHYSKDRLVLYLDNMSWPLGILPKDGSKECIVESFRLFFSEGTSCISAIIILCTISFGSLAFLLLSLVVFLKHRFDRKLRRMEERWKDQSIFKKFEGWEISRSKVVINRKLGEGQFGTVYGGECHIEPHGWQAVAVKTLKRGSTISEKLDFLAEAEMMKNVDHDNIVKLIGVCTEIEPIYTVMEFMLYGDLKTFLLARRNLVNEKNRNDDDEVSNRRLTSMALDVAKALAYLADIKYVHRDVACRNCLVNAYRSVKLADFGMTRCLNEKNYYRFSRKGMLPVRWMAPESLVEGVFTPQSDIWSYGVLLYEVITFGAFPFLGLNNNQVLERVKSGQTLPFPLGIKPDLELLLKACWQLNPEKRITASRIAVHLQNCPHLICPSLDSPQSLITNENPTGVELQIPDKSRKLSLSLNARVSNNLGPLSVVNNRKRSMSGNMMLPPLTASLSEDGLTSNLDALNLNLIEEGGEEPPFLPAQYISTSRFLSLGPKDVERERQLLVRKPSQPMGIWTNMTPV